MVQNELSTCAFFAEKMQNSLSASPNNVWSKDIWTTSFRLMVILPNISLPLMVVEKHTGGLKIMEVGWVMPRRFRKGD